MEEKSPSCRSIPSVKNSHLLKSNNPPSHSEQLSLEATRSDIIASLEELTVAIATTKQQLERIETKQSCLQKLLEEYSIPLAPIRRVPRDVTLCIFKELEESWPKDSFDLTKGAWKLAQVCSSWRSILYDTPSFWNRIHINLRPRLPIPTYSNSILSAIINRTKSLHLDIVFSTSRVTSHIFGFDVSSRNLLELLCSHSDRWRSLDVTIPMTHWQCFRQVQNTLLKLEVLSIDIPCDEILTLGRCTLFSAAPKLKRLSLGTKLFPPPFILSTPCTELCTQLHPRFLPYLSEMIPETVRNLAIIEPSQPYNPDDLRALGRLTPVTLPSVKFLGVKNLTDQTLSYLTLPNLRKLRLFQWYPSQSTGKGLESFISRSSLNRGEQNCVPKLHIASCGACSPSDARLLFTHFAFLRCLILTSSPSSIEYGQELRTTMGGLLAVLILPVDRRATPSLPRLTVLEINFSGWSCLHVRNLVHEVVLSRTQALAGPSSSSENVCNLQQFSYTDSKHEFLTLSTYDQLWSEVEDEREIYDSFSDPELY